MDFKEASSIIIKQFEALNWDIEPKGMYAPIEHILSNGGKRLRPSLLLLAHSVFNPDLSTSINAAIGVEIFHNSTLLHDDLMDNADVRRGEPTVHVKWDANTAILSGDAMILLASKYVSDVPDQSLKKVLEIYNTITLQVCDGQQYDMDFETRMDVSVEEYLKMIELKTAVLLAGSLKMGAVLGGASDEDAERMYDFGLNLGLAFQLIDDLLDVYGDEATFGKAIGGDISSNKKTFMLISAIQKASGESKDALNKWLLVKDFDRKEKVQAVTDLYNQLGIRELAEEKATYFSNKSFEMLAQLSVQNESTKALHEVAQKLLSRNA